MSVKEQIGELVDKYKSLDERSILNVAVPMLLETNSTRLLLITPGLLVGLINTHIHITCVVKLTKR